MRRAEPARPLVRIEQRAADDLQFIRQTLERSGTFTAVPGAGGMIMGVIGGLAALIASRVATPERWLATWLTAAVLASGLGFIAMRRKAHRFGEPLNGAAARQFASSFGTPVLAAALLTVGLWQTGTWNLMPPLWLLLYGTAVLAGGAFSVPIVRAVGIVFLLLGVGALVTPPALGNVWLAIGFGGVHLVAGFYIVKVHGG